MKIIVPIEFDESLIKKRSTTFSVPGKPFGKQRPKVTTRYGYSMAYTPKKTVEYENKVRSSYIQTNGNNKLEGPISAKILGVFGVPKSMSKKQQKKLIEEKHHTKKPDCDNIGKSILDALNGIAYKDDSQVCKLYIEKIYGEESRTEVVLEEI